MNNENKQSDGVGYPPGTQIGKYEITERLGIGGQAIVYKAHDPLLDRYVAIKQISSHLAENPDFLERFRKEAQILARLATSQPALVTIHELIQEERGLFIVMEFVSGSTLETMLNNNPGPVEPKAVLQILWRLAGGLHAVHSAGVIHRDIKPGNIIVGEGLKVKIADFGVAAMSDGQTSMALGTTKYMAPELYGGKTVDARADMYSLGFIAYEMLLGRAKFNEVFAEVVHDKHSEALRWMKWHGNEQVKAPALNEMNSAIPRPLADIVATMMAKNPEHRFASMEQLGRAIKASFSPRAGTQRDAGSAQPRSPNGALPSPQGEASALDSGEDLEVSAGPDTAPLPRARMPLKTKLIWAGAGVLALVVLIVAWTVVTSMSRKNLQEKAEAALAEAKSAYSNKRFEEAEAPFTKIIALYDASAKEPSKAVMRDALKAYRDKQYNDAMDAFDAIVNLRSGQDEAKAENALMEAADKNYQDAIDKDGQSQFADAEALFKKASIQYGIVAKVSPVGDAWARSSVREHLARARQAVENATMAKDDAQRQPFWTIASAEVDDPKSPSSAEKAWEEAVRRMGQRPWVAPLKKEMSDFTDARLSCLVFWSAIDEATVLYHRGKFEEARKTLTQKIQANPWAHPTPPQTKLLRELYVRIDVGDFERQFGAIMASAQNFVKQGRFAEANEELDKASTLLKDKIAEGITPDARAKCEKEIADLREKSRVGGDYDKEIKLADKAKEDNEKPGELEHLRNALHIRPSKELDDRIKALQSDMALDEAKALAKDGNFVQAREKLEESLRFKDNAEAKALLNKIALSEKYQTLLKEADAAFNRQDYKKAAELYQQALDIDPSADEIKAKLSACLYQVKFAAAPALIKAKKYDEAVKVLEECRKLMPDNGATIDQLEEEIKTTRDYDKAIDEGKQCLKDRQWSKARQHFEDARKIKNEAQEAKDLISQAHYGENLERGRSEFDQGHWESALGYFKIAQGKYDCEEIRKLIAAAEDKVKANK